MTRIFILLLPLSLMSGACDKGPAQADKAPAERAGSAAEQGPRSKTPEERAAFFIAKFDANADGALDPVEVARHPLSHKFRAIDVDRDGRLTFAELSAMTGQPDQGKHGKGKHGKSPEQRAARLLARYDTNGDGALDLVEVAGHRVAGQFAALDLDHDGRLTRVELLAVKGKGHDKKGRRKSPAERADRALARLDANRDGVLVADEIKDQPAYVKKFARIDGDGDGKLTRDELVAFKATKYGL